MKSAPLIARLIELEAKIDPVLFRKNPLDEDDVSANDHKGVKQAAAVAAVGAGGYAAHRAVKTAGGYQAVTSNALGKASDFLKDRKAAAIEGATAGRKTGMDVANRVGAIVDKGVAAAPAYATKAAEHVATGIQVAKTGALDVIKSLKKKLPMLVPHLAKIGLQKKFNGHLIELDESLDAFLAARDKAKDKKVNRVTGAVIGAGAAGAVGHALIKRKGGYKALAGRLAKVA